MRRFLYVDSSALPDYFIKVLETKKLLESGSVKNVTKAAEMNGISRSTYYKYKDSVFDNQLPTYSQYATFMLTLRHESGVLSNVLSLFSSMGASILTISQSLPAGDVASVMLTADMGSDGSGSDELLRRAHDIKGLMQIQLLSMSQEKSDV